MPLPATIKPMSFSSASPAFSSFMGTPSSLQQGVDCSSSQIYHPQPQIEELAFWQSLQKLQTSKDPSGSYQSQQPVQYHRFIGPQLKPLQNQQTGMGPPRSHHFQLPQDLRFFEPQLQSSQWPQPNMEPPWSHHAQLQQQQHPSFTERPLKIGGQPSQGILPQSVTPSPVESFKSEWLFHNSHPWTINQDKSAGKSVQDVCNKPRLVVSISTGKNFPSTSYKGKEKVTSSSAYTGFKSPMNEPSEFAFSGNRGQCNTLYSPNPQLESKHPSLPTTSDVNKGNDDPVWNAILEVEQALQACKFPGAAIPNPYGDADESMFDIPFFKNTESSNPSGSVNHLTSEPLANNMKGRKGKANEVVNKKRKR